MNQTSTKFFHIKDCVKTVFSKIQILFLHNPYFTIKSQTIQTHCFILFLLVFSFCKTTNAGFIKNAKLNYHHLQIKLKDFQPRIHLFVNPSTSEEEKKLTFVIDTGSNISLIKENLFREKGLQKKIQLKSMSGFVDKDFFELDLDIFDESKNLISENSKFHSLSFDSKFNFDGILGNDILEKFDLFLELPDSAFLIHQNQVHSHIKNFEKIPFEYTNGHIILEMKLNNFSSRFILDTGAGLSYLNQKRAKELDLKVGGDASFIDLAGKVHETIYHIGENLCVAENLCQKKIDLLSGNSIEDFLTEDGNLDGILGINWINQYSIVIDYPNQSLYIKQR